MAAAASTSSPAAKGKDTLTGGAAADTFDYNAIIESQVNVNFRDTITDFLFNMDKIDLSTIDAQSWHAGNQAFTFPSARPPSPPKAKSACSSPARARWSRSTRRARRAPKCTSCSPTSPRPISTSETSSPDARAPILGGSGPGLTNFLSPVTGRRDHPKAYHPQERLRLRCLPRASGAGDRYAAWRGQCVGRHAHGIGEVSLFPGAGASARWAHGRRVAARSFDEGPGGGAEARGRGGGDDQLVAGPRSQCGHLAARGGGHGDHTLSLARAADDGGDDRGIAEAANRADRRRRGALHLAMGAELQARIPGAERAARGVPRRPHRRLHGDGGRGHAARYRGAHVRGRCAGVRARLRPAEHQARRFDQNQWAEAAPALHGGPQGRDGDRLLPVAQGHRAERQRPARGGL